MKRPEELSHMLTEMYNDTKDGKIRWNLSVQTTENNEVSEKPVEVEDGVSWTIDECYVSYYCKYKGQDFLMITYEMIKYDQHDLPPTARNPRVPASNAVAICDSGVRCAGKSDPQSVGITACDEKGRPGECIYGSVSRKTCDRG